MADPVTPETLKAMPKDQLEELLLMALEAQAQTTKNMHTMSDLISKADDRIRFLEDVNRTQEAEIIMLKAKP
jgi:hypothetical protein